MPGTNDILTHRTSMMFISGDNVCQEPNVSNKKKKWKQFNETPEIIIILIMKQTTKYIISCKIIIKLIENYIKKSN